MKFRKSRGYIEETQIRPWVINQYISLKNQGFTEEEISDCVILNYAERKEMDDMHELKDSVENLIDKMVSTPKEETIKESIKEAKENNEVVDAEIIKEPSIEKQIQDELKKISEKYEPVKESVVEEEPVKESVVEEDPSKWTDEEVIEKALHELTDKMEYQDKEQMSDLLRESFNSDKQLVDIYRKKYIAHYKLVNNNLLNNDNKSTENKEEGGEKEIKSEVIENKEEGGEKEIKSEVIESRKEGGEKEIKSEVIESRKEGDKKVEPIAEDNKIDDLNIDNEMFDMLVDDVYDQYKMIFNIKKDKLKDLIRKVLQEKPEILKSTNYYFVCMRICEIIENLIMENTIEDNEEDEILKQLNSIVE
jgi:hypothetical protein